MARKSLRLNKKFLDQALPIVMRYHFVFERNLSLQFIGSALEMPYVFADGATIQDCYKTLVSALQCAVGTMLEMKQKPPESAQWPPARRMKAKRGLPKH